MTKPFDLIARFFKKPGDSPSADGITPGPIINASAMSFVKLLITLKVMTLSPAQRPAMAGKGDPGQRRRSEAFHGFLVRRPDFVQQVQIDPVTYQTIIDKDESYDVLVSTVALCRQCASDGQLLVAAWLSEKIGVVLDYVGKIWAPDAPASLLVERVNFGAVVVGQGEQQVKAMDQQARIVRNQLAVQQGLTQAEMDKTSQLHIDKLTQDSLAGAGPLEQAPALPASTKAATATNATKTHAGQATKAAKTKTSSKAKTTKAKVSKTKTVH